MRVLIVEDNEILSSNIKKYLELEWIESKVLSVWASVVYELTMEHYDAIIMDVWLPDISWFEVCNKIRESGRSIPILILTARNTLNDKIEGFKGWADDYLTKPFDYEELLVRLVAITKRSYANKWNIIKEWNLEINIDDKKVMHNSKEVDLSKLEFNLLVYLAQNKGHILSKENILEKVWWEYDAFSETRTLDVYVWYLRKKLGKEIVKTVRGQGYIFE